MDNKNFTAIIPLRSNSKEIINKNIKEINKKPLCWYIINSILKSKICDKIIISSNSEKYFNIIKKLFINYDLFFHKRSKKSIGDNCSTEFLINEIMKKKLIETDNIIMCQATSPLVLAKHFKEGTRKFNTNKLDSLFSSYLDKSFIWRVENKILKTPCYNIYKRPMRQKFKPNYVENGAFYIFKKKRLSKIQE